MRLSSWKQGRIRESPQVKVMMQFSGSVSTDSAASTVPRARHGRSTGSKVCTSSVSRSSVNFFISSSSRFPMLKSS